MSSACEVPNPLEKLVVVMEQKRAVWIDIVQRLNAAETEVIENSVNMIGSVAVDDDESE